MRDLKDKVHHKVRPEGSIDKAYLIDKCLIFYSRYLNGIKIIFNRSDRNNDKGEYSSATSRLSIFPLPGHHLGKSMMKKLNEKL